MHKDIYHQLREHKKASFVITIIKESIYRKRKYTHNSYSNSCDVPVFGIILSRILNLHYVEKNK